LHRRMCVFKTERFYQTLINRTTPKPNGGGFAYFFF